MKVIFIVGVGRSGTSLLQSMLNAHSEIVALPETQFFRKYLAVPYKRKQIEKQGVETFKAVLKKDSSFHRLKVPIENLKSLEKEKLEINEVYHEILEIFIEKESKKYAVDKDPRNLDFIDSIIKGMDNIKIIQIVRDPRDVVLSKTKAKWSAGRPYWLHALIGEAQLYSSHMKSNSLSREIFSLIKYEDLIMEPNTVLNKLSYFIDVKYEKGMQSFSKSAKKLVSKEEMQWKKETIGPLLKNNANKWEKELTSKQIMLIEKVSKLTMKKFGYKKSNLKVSFQTRLFIKVFEIASFFFNRFYFLRIKWETK